MGFKCPVCSTDFGRDKKAWVEHCGLCFDGAAKDIVDIFERVTEGSIGANKKKVDSNG